MNSSLSLKKKEEIIEKWIFKMILPFVDEKMNVIKQNQQMNLFYFVDSYRSFKYKTEI